MGRIANLTTLVFLYFRVCACCSTEANESEISRSEYKSSDVMFSCLSSDNTEGPVLAIPKVLRWKYDETDTENRRLGRYKLRVCNECRKSLRHQIVPANAVVSIPLNHFYGVDMGRHLSEDLISAHKDLFAGMSYVTRSLLALTKPIITVITVRVVYV